MNVLFDRGLPLDPVGFQGDFRTVQEVIGAVFIQLEVHILIGIRLTYYNRLIYYHGSYLESFVGHCL